MDKCIKSQKIDAELNATETTYKIEKNVFVINSVFKKESKDTLGGVLLRLILFNEGDKKYDS